MKFLDRRGPRVISNTALIQGGAVSSKILICTSFSFGSLSKIHLLQVVLVARNSVAWPTDHLDKILEIDCGHKGTKQSLPKCDLIDLKHEIKKPNKVSNNIKA